MVLIVGDFNYSHINWWDSPTSRNLIDICEQVEEGTRGGNTLNIFFFFKRENNTKFESWGKFWT